MRTRSFLWLAVGVLILGGAAALVRADVNGFSTRSAPSIAERFTARTARRWAVPRSMRETANPVSFTPEVWAEARAHFADHCATCHANNGSGDTEIGRNLYPKVPNMRLADTQALTDGELYWIIENGIRLTGMPAWGDGTDHDLATWKLVHFIRHLRDLTPDELDEMEKLNPRTPAESKEEEEDQQFLNGQSTEPSAETEHHHH
jgi:mono/diheme cytochrome c family protein